MWIEINGDNDKTVKTWVLYECEVGKDDRPCRIIIGNELAVHNLMISSEWFNQEFIDGLLSDIRYRYEELHENSSVDYSKLPEMNLGIVRGIGYRWCK